MQAFKSIYLFFFLGSGLCLKAQDYDRNFRLASRLDSMSASASVSRHFARLYLETVLISAHYYQNEDSLQQAFIGRFEHLFAGYFFRAVENRGTGVGSGAWQTYYSDSSFSPLQYQLLGINAHINADLSVALTDGFTIDELKTHKKSFIHFQKSLRQQFLRFYAEHRNTTILTRALDKVPFRLVRLYGSWMMARWRKRQFRLAIWHFEKPRKAAGLKSRTARHKERTDRLILRYL